MDKSSTHTRKEYTLYVDLRCKKFFVLTWPRPQNAAEQVVLCNYGSAGYIPVNISIPFVNRHLKDLMTLDEFIAEYFPEPEYTDETVYKQATGVIDALKILHLSRSITFLPEGTRYNGK